MNQKPRHTSRTLHRTDPRIGRLGLLFCSVLFAAGAGLPILAAQGKSDAKKKDKPAALGAAKGDKKGSIISSGASQIPANNEPVITAAPKPDLTPAEPPKNPGLLMEDFKTEVTSVGKLKQQIQAASCVMDEENNRLLLHKMQVKLYDQGEYRGTVQSASGTIWLASKPEEGHAKDDMMMSGDTRYSMADGSIIKAETMYLHSETAVLTTDDSFVQQMRATADKFWIGRGEHFEIKVIPERSTLDSWTYTGTAANRAGFTLTDKPEIAP